ncbi:MAG TPA: hypothetical protein VGH43_18665 [Jatrophihabitans sp.]
MSERESPLSKVWKRAKESAPRQKVIASTIHAVRRSKPHSAAQARDALIAQAAKQGVTDLSDKELATMTDAVTMSAKEAASTAVTKGSAGVKSLWTSLQTARPSWIDLPDNIAAFNLRSDQRPVDVAVEIQVPGTLDRLTADLAADADGVRSFNVWLAIDPRTDVAAVCVGRERLGKVPDQNARAIREELQRRRFWVGARLADDVVTIRLPDHA